MQIATYIPYIFDNVDCIEHLGIHIAYHLWPHNSIKAMVKNDVEHIVVYGVCIKLLPGSAARLPETF